MLECVGFQVRGDWWCFDTDVRGTYPITHAFEFWMAYMAREHLRLGVIFRAQAIMLQIPGAAKYRELYHDDTEKDLPPEADDPYVQLHDADPGIVLGILAECLSELDADHLLAQIPAAKHIRPKKLSAKWQKYLVRQSTYEGGLLNIVAECLDELIVRPGLAEIDRRTGPMWWQQYWSKMKDEQ